MPCAGDGSETAGAPLHVISLRQDFLKRTARAAVSEAETQLRRIRLDHPGAGPLRIRVVLPAASPRARKARASRPRTETRHSLAAGLRGTPVLHLRSLHGPSCCLCVLSVSVS